MIGRGKLGNDQLISFHSKYIFISDQFVVGDCSISFYVHNHHFVGVVITMESSLSKVFLRCEKEHDFCPLSETSVEMYRNAFH